MSVATVSDVTCRRVDIDSRYRGIVRQQATQLDVVDGVEGDFTGAGAGFSSIGHRDCAGTTALAGVVVDSARSVRSDIGSGRLKNAVSGVDLNVSDSVHRSVAAEDRDVGVQIDVIWRRISTSVQGDVAAVVVRDRTVDCQRTHRGKRDVVPAAVVVCRVLNCRSDETIDRADNQVAGVDHMNVTGVGRHRERQSGCCGI